MRNEHILDILDEQSFSQLSETEKKIIESHTVKCGSCLRAYEVAKISSFLLKTNVTQNFEPSPFFHARLLANLPEKQSSVNPFLVLGKLWRASGALVVVMITTVVGLIAVTVFAPDYSKAAAGDNDSADIVILDEKIPGRELSNEQMLQLIYGSESNKEK